ncbi:MAG: metallophosphoesterase [Proteobacteria bacterium]|nr:metallophosphoesterase [Pseudomonadota bacterium]
MERWFFASDLHGREDRYGKLFDAIGREAPGAVLLGGDLLPGLAGFSAPTFVDFLADGLAGLRRALGDAYPRVLAIPGNDDPAAAVEELRGSAFDGVLELIDGEGVTVGGRTVFGYACVPPSPFALKDFERYDVSRFVDPGAISPEEGIRSGPAEESDVRYGTIAGDLEALVGEAVLGEAVLLLHSPPYGTKLDRAALDGRMIDGVPLDVHVGSIAVRRLIESRQPRLTLHGHVHESARITGAWRDAIGRTHMLSAAHDGPELALVRFDPADLDNATRELL